MTENQGLEGEFFINGDVACAEGAISAGCRFFAGYPITPATEVAERILMMENLGLGVMLETPCVLVNIQRAAPSTGLPTMVGQGDMMQARWGSHGSYEIIALAPTSPQDIFDLTITAFNLSEKYRVPVLIMSDEVVGHMSEKVIMPRVAQEALIDRRRPDVGPEEYLPYRADGDLVPPMAMAGEGYHFHVTGLTHDERGYPVMTAEAQDLLVRRLVDKIRLNRHDIIKYKEVQVEDADIIVCAYGVSVRIAQSAVRMARDEGIRAGLLHLVTIWPFAEERIRELSLQAKAFVVPEINYGQIVLEVERCAGGRARAILVPHMGGSVHSPQTILEAIREAAQ
jgi:2-oxoglutarate ferredoxin oxidoreductase subunit alpha